MKSQKIEILKELGIYGLTAKQWVVLTYFIMSLCLLSIGDESPIWVIVIVVINFFNSARLVRKHIKIKDCD